MYSLIEIKRYCIAALFNRGFDVSDVKGLPYLAMGPLGAVCGNSDALGVYVSSDHLIVIDETVDEIREYRETLVHEMCHFLLEKYGMSEDDEHSIIEGDIESKSLNGIQAERMRRCASFVLRNNDVSENEVYAEWIKRYAQGWRKAHS